MYKRRNARRGKQNDLFFQFVRSHEWQNDVRWKREHVHRFVYFGRRIARTAMRSLNLRRTRRKSELGEVSGVRGFYLHFHLTV